MINNLEYDIMNERADLDIDIAMNTRIYEESSSISIKEYFHSLYKVLSGYIKQKKDIFNYRNEKDNLLKKLKYIEGLCKDKKIANTKIMVRGYGTKLLETEDLDEQIIFLKNMYALSDTRINYPKIYEYFSKYMINRSGWDTFYNVKIKQLPNIYKYSIVEIDKKINELEETLHDFNHYINAEESTGIEKKSIGIMFEKIKETIKHQFDIISMQIEIIQFEIGYALNNQVDEMAKKYVKEPSMKTQMKHSKKIMEITYGDDTYNIYETDYPELSCFNYGGNEIYIDKGFFNQPKGYQLAILYHEIGHHQCKHFKPNKKEMKNLVVEDETALIKRIKRDANKFYFNTTHRSKFYSKDYEDGTEFLYLLLEWEADRFSSKIVGKPIMKQALTSRFNKMLDNYYDKPNSEQLKYILYNKDRMKMRTLSI